MSEQAKKEAMEKMSKYAFWNKGLVEAECSTGFLGLRCEVCRDCGCGGCGGCG